MYHKYHYLIANMRRYESLPPTSKSYGDRYDRSHIPLDEGLSLTQLGDE